LQSHVPNKWNCPYELYLWCLRESPLEKTPNQPIRDGIGSCFSETEPNRSGFQNSRTEPNRTESELTHKLISVIRISDFDGIGSRFSRTEPNRTDQVFENLEPNRSHLWCNPYKLIEISLFRIKYSLFYAKFSRNIAFIIKEKVSQTGVH